MNYTQENRPIAIDTPLGEDALLLRGFTGQEGISRLFSFDLDLLAESSISFNKIVGQRVTIRIDIDDIGKRKRYINGFVSRFALSGSDARFTYYRAEIVPWLWFLTRTADCRIFQNMTVPDIITKVFKDLGFTDCKNRLEGTFEPRDYCVQYRETDFNFVSRLMEQYGIFYFFEHEEEKHTLVLANSPTVHQPCPGQAKVRCDFAAGVTLEEDIITDWQMEQELRPGKYALADYNFETPSTSLVVNVTSTVNVGSNGKYEVYDYPGEYLKKAQGEQLAKIRMEEEEAPHVVASGSGTCRAFTPGYKFDLVGHDSPQMDKCYVLTEVQHMASVGESYTDFSSGGDMKKGYSNHFACIPFDVPFRPPRVTPRPTVQGPQTAIVVGRAGEEIFTDKYGRVKVQFHWDREGKRNENSSCWIRVSHPWAGKGWGAVAIPRIGQEVIVDFLEGDPDQPIITGRVYNNEQMPPYELPANQTQSGIRSRSIGKGSDPDNFNEIRFEDKKGSEEMYIHAEKDQNTVVENNRNQVVGSNKTIEVGVDHTESIGRDMVINVGGSKTETVKINSAETVLVAKELTIGGLYQVSVGAAMNETVGAAKAEEVIGYKVETVGGKKTLSIASDSTETIGGGKGVTISKDLTADIGGKHSETTKGEYNLKAKKIIIEAEDELQIVVGKSSIVMKKDGEILIKGKDVNTQASGKINIKASGEITMQGSKIKEN